MRYEIIAIDSCQHISKHNCNLYSTSSHCLQINYLNLLSTDGADSEMIQGEYMFESTMPSAQTQYSYECTPLSCGVTLNSSGSSEAFSSSGKSSQECNNTSLPRRLILEDNLSEEGDSSSFLLPTPGQLNAAVFGQKDHIAASKNMSYQQSKTDRVTSNEKEKARR